MDTIKMTRYQMACGRFTLEMESRTLIMGILNVTPDSFSDGGHFFKLEDALAHAENMIQDGADIIDIGGESTRPFSDPVSVDEELNRVIPVIEHLAKRISVPISIDTTKSVVAEKAVAAGAAIINDVSAFNTDPRMADVVAQTGVPVILMHMKGTPKTMQANPHYDDPVAEIMAYINQTVSDAVKKGIDRNRIIIDPGIGFGKTFEHNLTLLNRLGEFNALGLPILVGASRKAFIRTILKDYLSSQSKVPLGVIDAGSQAVVALAVSNGAHIVRVHDVAGACYAARVADAVKTEKMPFN